MKSGIIYKQGEILLVPFPFSDLTIIKKRPVLVLSQSLDNKNSEDLITCGITGNLKDRKHAVLINNRNLQKGQLSVQSAIKVDKLFTIKQSIVVKKIARLNQDTFSKVKDEFHSLI